MADTENLLHFTFDELQIKAVVSASKNKETAAKYIDALNQKLMTLAALTLDLKKQLKEVGGESTEISREIKLTQQEADEHYRTTIQFVVQQLIDSNTTPEPPWKAVIDFDKGLPIGINLVREVEQS